MFSNVQSALQQEIDGIREAGLYKEERVITSRVARRHYLMATLQPFKEGHHPEQYRVPSLDGKDRCKVAIQTNNVETDERGYVYIVDRANTGLHILELTGPARAVAGLP